MEVVLGRLASAGWVLEWRVIARAGNQEAHEAAHAATVGSTGPHPARIQWFRPGFEARAAAT
eukprot:NODE_15586_length_225_cov_0.835294.p3 GENE.NODE_15586_length_225_cov_0.835294~~NODE_15586_length_225_cov_0.835294.p3  ORF type:complete len:62 (+),score=6.70 NODE_15586_length_225_cov_0.835294:3-188(+)